MFVLSWSLPQASPVDGLKPLQRVPVFCIERKHLHWNLLCWNIVSVVTSLRVSRCCLFPAATSPHPFLFSTHTSQPRPSLKIPHSHISCYSFLIIPLLHHLFFCYFHHLVKLFYIFYSRQCMPDLKLFSSCTRIPPIYHPKLPDSHELQLLEPKSPFTLWDVSHF